MILAENLQAPLQPRSLPLCSPCPFVRGAHPACPDPTAVSFPQHLPRFLRVLVSFSPLVTRHPFIPSALEGPLISRGVMLPYKSFRSNTSTTVCKCSFQKTYSRTKLFRINTYEKQGGGVPFVAISVFLSPLATRLPRAYSARGHSPVPSGVEGPLSFVVVLSSVRWSPVVFPWEIRPISFPFTPLPDSHPLNEGGYTSLCGNCGVLANRGEFHGLIACPAK